MLSGKRIAVVILGGGFLYYVGPTFLESFLKSSEIPKYACEVRFESRTISTLGGSNYQRAQIATDPACNSAVKLQTIEINGRCSFDLNKLLKTGDRYEFYLVDDDFKSSFIPEGVDRFPRSQCGDIIYKVRVRTDVAGEQTFTKK